jgi:hypothetical protein
MAGARFFIEWDPAFAIRREENFPCFGLFSKLFSEQRKNDNEAGFRSGKDTPFLPDSTKPSQFDIGTAPNWVARPDRRLFI